MSVFKSFLEKRGEPTPDILRRVPPGQHLTEKWPVLHYGSVPRVNLTTWDFQIGGLVAEPVRFTWEEFTALPREQRLNDIHCVTRWSKLDNTWDGVTVQEVLSHVRVLPEATHVMVLAEAGFTANLALDDFNRPENMFAFNHNGQALAPEHGHPLRLVVPHLYFWKSVKWVRGLQFMAEDAPGFWERNGYHMRGDPWAEERYSSWW